MMNHVSRQPNKILPLLWLSAILAVVLLPPPPADAGVMLICNTMCSGGDCTVTAACSDFIPNTCSFVNESLVMASNAACTLGAIDGMAMAMGTMGTPASCEFYFNVSCGATSMCTMGSVSSLTGTCVVNAADGLPVELMDFSVNGSDSDSSPESSGVDE